MSIFEIKSDTLKYVDFFGATFSFYSERNRKFYTNLGGLLTLISIMLSIILFIYNNIDNFSHNIPTSTTSISKEPYKNIKFGKEKIWIPWRIRDFGGKTINHNNILYPIIFYYKGKRNKLTNNMDVYYELLDYKKCSETSMINTSDIYMIDIELDQLYCIDMEDIEVGGSWDSDFLNLVTLDLYSCKNGIDYDENNTNCTKYEKIREIAGENNNFQFEIYYPVVHFQPLNKTYPIFVKYTNYFYHLSIFSNKIDRMYLQQHILIDDEGLISKDEKSYTYWGIVSFNGDSYTTGDKKDLMNEGSTSRFYSFNIYLKNEITHYHRTYKKLFLIVADGLPIINVILVVFKLFAKILKISSGNKKLTELLFENLKEKQSLYRIKTKKIGSKSDVFDISDHKNSSINKINNDISNNYLTPKYNYVKKKNSSLLKKGKEQYPNIIQNIKPKLKSNNQLNIIKNFSNFNKVVNNSNSNASKDSFGLSDKRYNIFSHLPHNEINSKNETNSQKNIDSKILKMMLKKQFIRKSLFPYKYYLCSIFIKNINTSKNYFCVTKKFIVVYNFICQLFDISSYLILQKEFQIIKNNLLEEKDRNIFEKSNKINVNDQSFNNDMKNCISSNNLSILGKIK